MKSKMVEKETESEKQIKRKQMIETDKNDTGSKKQIKNAGTKNR